MPFVIDYSPVSALGSLAISSGSAIGEASSRQAQLEHQRRTDFAVLNNLLQRKSAQQGFQQQRVLQDDEQAFRASQADAARAFDQSRFSQELGYRQQQAEAERAFEAAQPSPAQQAGQVEQAKLMARMQAEQAESQQERQQFNQWAQQQGYNQQQAEQLWSDYIGRQRGYTQEPEQQQARQPRAPGGQIESAAFEATLAGDFAGVEQFVQSFQNEDPLLLGENPQELMLRVRGAQLNAVRQMSPQQLQQVLADPNAPPQVKQEALERLQAPRNNPAGAQPPSPLSGMGDADLYAALGG